MINLIVDRLLHRLPQLILAIIVFLILQIIALPHLMRLCPIGFDCYSISQEAIKILHRQLEMDILFRQIMIVGLSVLWLGIIYLRDKLRHKTQVQMLPEDTIFTYDIYKRTI